MRIGSQKNASMRSSRSRCIFFSCVTKDCTTESEISSGAYPTRRWSFAWTCALVGCMAVLGWGGYTKNRKKEGQYL